MSRLLSLLLLLAGCFSPLPRFPPSQRHALLERAAPLSTAQQAARRGRTALVVLVGDGRCAGCAELARTAAWLAGQAPEIAVFSLADDSSASANAFGEAPPPRAFVVDDAGRVRWTRDRPSPEALWNVTQVVATGGS